MIERDPVHDPVQQEASALRARAKQKLADVRKRTVEVEQRTRRMSYWGEVNGFAPKIHQALRGEK